MISDHVAPTRAETRNFRMHPQMLFDVIRRQAGTLAKALLELVMNSVDAGCKRCDVTITEDFVEVVDDGKGMTKKSEITTYFEVFGQPHEEGERKTYGTFRMGRGQAFAFGRNTWRTGPFEMHVDIKGRGLDYDLRKAERAAGCRVRVDLYDALEPSALQQTIDTVTRWVKYAPVAVVVNGEDATRDPAGEEWDVVTDEAYVKLDARAGLAVFNLGIHCMDLGNYQYGTGGVIVSRKQLRVNFARNDVMDDCEVWKKIKPLVDQRAREKIRSKKTLDDGERQRLINILCREKEVPPGMADQPLFGLANGRWVSAARLFDLWRGTGANRFTSAPLGDRKADRVLQQKLAVVLSKEAVEMWRGKDLDLILGLAWRVSRGDAKASYQTVPFSRIAAGLSDRHDLVPAGELTNVEDLWLRLAQNTQHEVYRGTTGPGEWDGEYKKSRRLVVGESDTALAWTDGFSYVALDRKFLRSLKFDVAGFFELGRVLLHEYCHAEDDTNNHVHMIEFYQKFHDEVPRVGDFARACLLKLPGMLKVLGRKMTRLSLADQDRLFQIRKELAAAAPPGAPPAAVEEVTDGGDGGPAEAEAPKGTPSPIKGKRLEDVTAQTYIRLADGRVPQRGKHYSFASALNRFVEFTVFESQRFLEPTEFPEHRATRVFTSLNFGGTLFDSGPLTGPLKPAGVRRRALDELAAALHGDLPDDRLWRHAGDCRVLMDRPCDCYRSELMALLDDTSDPRRAFTQVQLARAVLAGDLGAAYPLVDWLLEHR